MSALIRSLAGWLAFCGSLPAATISLTSIEGFLHAGGDSTPVAAFSAGGPGYSSSLDSGNLGEFEFLWSNTTAQTLNGVTFTIFLDADVDRDTNTYFNEYGDFVSNALPSLAPAGAIGFSAWEIDEPEYAFGNIYTHSLAGALDNTNALPPSGPPDDVSHALLFSIGSLAAGDTLRVVGRLSLTDAAGLAHIDPDSPFTFYFNGYGLVETGAVAPIPEPSTLLLMGAALILMKARGARSR